MIICFILIIRQLFCVDNVRRFCTSDAVAGPYMYPSLVVTLGEWIGGQAFTYTLQYRCVMLQSQSTLTPLALTFLHVHVPVTIQLCNFLLTKNYEQAKNN